MKKQFLVLFAAVLMLTLTACTEQAPDNNPKKPAASVSAVLEEKTGETEKDKAQEEALANAAKEETTNPQPSPEPEKAAQDAAKPTLKKFDKIDLDLSNYSTTMLFAEMYNMTLMPEDYDGKIIKIKGQFSSYERPKTKEVCYIVFCMDMTACCGQAMDFILQDPSQHPEKEIQPDAEITVVGRFEIYEENADYGISSFRLADAYLD